MLLEFGMSAHAREGAEEIVTRAVHQTVRAIQDEAKALAEAREER